jgi:hypothetical protein
VETEFEHQLKSAIMETTQDVLLDVCQIEDILAVAR